MTDPRRRYEEHGTDPETGLTEQDARHHAAEVTGRTERILSGRGPRPPLAPIGVVLLGGLVVWMTVAIIRLYPHEVLTPTRLDGAIATVLAFVAIRVASTTHPAPFSAMLGLLLGLVLVGLGLFASDSPTVQDLRIINGIVATAGCVLCLVSPLREPDPV